MVVKSYEAINRLRQAAQTANMPIPSMLSYTLIQVRSNLFQLTVYHSTAVILTAQQTWHALYQAHMAALLALLSAAPAFAGKLHFMH
jgi:hypothetical protein